MSPYGWAATVLMLIFQTYVERLDKNDEAMLLTKIDKLEETISAQNVIIGDMARDMRQYKVALCNNMRPEVKRNTFICLN